jgi:serine protease Do
MKVWITAAVTLALVAGLSIGAAVAPVARGQSRTWERVVQVAGGSGRIGVSVRDASPEEAKGASLASAGGVVIEEVREDSPAEKAGFREGDVVIEFDGERVRSTRQFTRLVQETPIGRQVPAVVVRDGQRQTLTVQPESGSSFRYFGDLDRLGDFSVLRPAPRPPSPPSPASPPSPPTPPAPAPFDHFSQLERFFVSPGRLGISVDTLSEQLAEYFGTREGVLVTSVSSSSAAEKAGVKAGDVITAINGEAVSSASELTRRAQRLDEGDEFTLAVVRDRKPLTLKGTVERRQPRRWTVQSIV